MKPPSFAASAAACAVATSHPRNASFVVMRPSSMWSCQPTGDVGREGGQPTLRRCVEPVIPWGTLEMSPRKELFDPTGRTTSASYRNDALHGGAVEGPGDVRRGLQAEHGASARPRDGCP